MFGHILYMFIAKTNPETFMNFANIFGENVMYIKLKYDFKEHTETGLTCIVHTILYLT